MSDNNKNGPAWGNSFGRWRGERQGDGNISRYPLTRPLVEECLSVAIRDILRIHGRSKMLKAADEGKALSFRMEGHTYEVFLCWEPHKLPGRTEKWSDIAQGNCRLYFICPSCRRRIRILYKNPQSLVPDLLPIGCKRCLGLVYASENSCKNKWWREIVRPLRRLYRKRERLLALIQTPRVVEELRRSEELIFVYRQRAKPKRRSKPPSGAKRQYRDVQLVLGLRSNSTPSLYL
jgi:hypothetical protein